MPCQEPPAPPLPAPHLGRPPYLLELCNMAAAKAKKDCSLKDMLTKPTGPLEDRKPLPRGLCPSQAEEGQVTRSLMGAHFASLRDDIQAVKKDLLADLQEVQRNLEEFGDRVSAVEDHKAECEGELLHQEVLWLQDLHTELQAHAEDLENRSQQKNIRIRGVPSRTEGLGLKE
ncbi:hypothetical protein NDU88_000667 [Pleurodeles waltl]|uniref:Uncharacterized protein n=1 Tax=Pleurodeles waltl TaxID=8319 RepID=A0AAV7KNY8_PLEWA|nr:hypothetical protein NDU88_000667 [Pleurodeles waltl]